MKEVLAVFGVLVGAIVGFTLLSGGSFVIGTAQSGPYLNVGFKGPRN